MNNSKSTNTNLEVLDLKDDAFFGKYLNEVVFSDCDLSLHHKVGLNDSHREFVQSGNPAVLLEFLANAVGCLSFAIVSGNKKARVTFKNLKSILFDRNIGPLLCLIENPRELNKLIKKNSTLFPTLVFKKLELEGGTVEPISLVYREVLGLKIGLIGRFPIDYKLACDLLEHMNSLAI